MNLKYFKIQKPVVWLEIKLQYRDLAKEFHPDKQQGSETQMQAINVEYAQLKTKYDPSSKKDWRQNFREIDISYQNIRKMQVQAAQMARMFQPAMEKQGKDWVINMIMKVINVIPEGLPQNVARLLIIDKFKAIDMVNNFDLPNALEKFDLERFVNSLKQPTPSE